ncbi:MAG: hypothetical protein LQ337_000873 [Flavoplaca oasis]|nr:MAG: hypothetical protein LQ337_000873 [Flavoplaca oasis]
MTYARNSMPPTTAFTAVAARRNFGGKQQAESVDSSSTSPNPSATGSTNPPDKGKRDWPPQVRSYVQRSFADGNILPDVDRQEMEIKLKKIISQSVEEGTLTTVDWDNLPLPQVMIQDERSRTHNSHFPPLPSKQNGHSILTNEIKSNKRKSAEIESSDSTGGQSLPWRQFDDRESFESRLSYPDKRPRNGAGPDSAFSKSNQAPEARKKRFQGALAGTSSAASMRPWRSSTTHEVEPTEPKGPISGLCQDLEKKYFRLTSAPNPDTVRPLHVLEKTLDHLKKKWRREKKYPYICDQFKSLRQDLTVQRIKTSFTVDAYEIHARIALEEGDLSEYNQCQTQLRALYAQNLGGHPFEFLAYRILYFLHTSNRTDMNDVLADLTPTEKRHPAVKHALDARSALALGNYHRFFQLYLDTPNMGAYLMDMFVGRERLSALSAVCRGYKPDVRLRFVTEELGFDSDEDSARFICEHGAPHLLEERDGGVHLLTGKAPGFFDSALKAVSARPGLKVPT